MRLPQYLLQLGGRPQFSNGALRFALAAAHLDHEGLVYPGFFSAFIPHSMLIGQFGMSPEDVENLENPGTTPCG